MSGHLSLATRLKLGGYVILPRMLDIVTWFDLLDLDDYVSFGGQG